MQKDLVGERQKLKRLEVLEAVEKAGRTREWFEGETSQMKDEDRGQATKDLLQIGLIEEVGGYPQQHPQPFRLTARGRAFLENVRARIGKDSSIDWKRVNEIEFPSSTAILEAELKTYEQHKNELLATARGKFALIRGTEVLGVYDSKMDAIAQGYKQFGNVPFLVKQIVEVETPQNFLSPHLGI